MLSSNNKNEKPDILHVQGRGDIDGRRFFIRIGEVRGNKGFTGSASACISVVHAYIRINATQGVNTWVDMGLVYA